MFGRGRLAQLVGDSNAPNPSWGKMLQTDCDARRRDDFISSFLLLCNRVR